MMMLMPSDGVDDGDDGVDDDGNDDDGIVDSDLLPFIHYNFCLSCLSCDVFPGPSAQKDR
jgi:hypothetical protein